MGSEVALVRYDAARAALQKAHSVDEAKAIHYKAEAVRAYARQVNDTDMVSWASEIKLRAMRRMGELLGPGGVERDRGKGGDRRSLSRPLIVKLPDLGVSLNASSLAQRIAAVPEKEFEKHLESMRAEHKEVTVAGVARLLESSRPHVSHKSPAQQ